jgi:hypothetical protein
MAPIRTFPVRFPAQQGAVEGVDEPRDPYRAASEARCGDILDVAPCECLNGDKTAHLASLDHRKRADPAV